MAKTNKSETEIYMEGWRQGLLNAIEIDLGLVESLDDIESIRKIMRKTLEREKAKTEKEVK